MVVDRGFRDSVNFLEENGFKVEMPIYLPKGCKQHSTEEANLSRLVTKVRWVVESANGRIKQWKLLDKVVPNTLISQVGDFVRIICAICNKFRPSLASMDQSSTNVAEKMLEKVKLPNPVKEFVLEQGLLNKPSKYTSIDAAENILSDFPKLDIDSLRDITMGVYQLKQCIHYSKEHLREDGSYDLMVAKEVDGLLQVQIKSRHSRNVIHKLWIQYDVNKNDCVSGWYCTCKVGSRVVGCCAHVASVMWYLGYQRWQDQPLIKTTGPGAALLNAEASLEE